MKRLLIRPGAIGDCILCLPAMEFLKADYTEVWVPSPVVPVIQFANRTCALMSTGIDMVGLGDIEMPAGLRDRLQSFDEIVSWYGANRTEFREAIDETGVACKFFPAIPDGSGHATDFYAQQVGAPSGLVPRIQPEPIEHRSGVLIHPFSGSNRKNWSLDSYQELAKGLSKPVEWIVGPDQELDGARRFDDLGELARRLAAAELYIGNDSGITHLAAAVGTQTLTLFGPSDPRIWAPRGAHVTVLYSEPLEMLTVSTVLQAANQLLDSR